MIDLLQTPAPKAAISQLTYTGTARLGRPAWFPNERDAPTDAP